MDSLEYKLFVDDERFPPDDDPAAPWVIVRNMEEATHTILTMGFPIMISFDHDLGENIPTGFDIAKWLVDYDLDFDVIPVDFDFYVHSQNPVGASNIEGLLRGYLNHKNQLTN
jgi:hypothetical protein